MIVTAGHKPISPYSTESIDDVRSKPHLRVPAPLYCLMKKIAAHIASPPPSLRRAPTNTTAMKATSWLINGDKERVLVSIDFPELGAELGTVAIGAELMPHPCHAGSHVNDAQKMTLDLGAKAIGTDTCKLGANCTAPRSGSIF
jgi:hypothetical protein